MHDAIHALGPLDGRYAAQLHGLAAVGSEAGLIAYRLRVEIAWLLALADCPDIAEIPTPPQADRAWLEALVQHCDAGAIKAIEKTTNHDVKAVEYWMKRQLAGQPFWCRHAEFVHFACTSEDINNLAYALMANDVRSLLLAGLEELSARLRCLAGDTAAMPMLSLTHGQPASPTTLGKELVNADARLRRQILGLHNQPILGKINGAVGNFNAHVAAYPQVDWPAVSAALVASLGLEHNPLTTQIEPHDWIAEYCHHLVRANLVLLDFCRDMWGYISRGYFAQQLKAGEVGSSTMPHKINPIDFENAEGNLGLANALLEHLAHKLPVSRWQRDLSDSTVLRNLGSAAGYSTLAHNSLLRGLGKICPLPDVMAKDLEANPEVLAEAIQTLMRRYGVEQPYEQLKKLTRGQRITRQDIAAFVARQPLLQPVQEQLAKLTPGQYTGLAEQLAKDYLHS